ncbi:hypothetical protein E2C01_073615 [Portunus trituberculatus]|uniref:Uncharacterized protein n=1 Tax=Portunus trituberculatus TaxID=210409 RepID=A0A5B7I5T2_PORTR|nr:hypothetical protein [Portunus trituberculatus]
MAVREGRLWKGKWRSCGSCEGAAVLREGLLRDDILREKQKDFVVPEESRITPRDACLGSKDPHVPPTV